MAFRGHTSSSSIHPHGRHPPFHSHSFSTRDRDFIPPFRWTTISTLFSSIHDHLSDQVGTYRYIRNSQRIVVSKEKNKNTSPHLSPSSYSYDPASHQYYSTWLQASTIIKSFLDPPILHSWSLFFFRLYRPTRDGNLLKGKNTCCWHIGSEFLIDLNGLNQFRSVHSRRRRRPLSCPPSMTPPKANSWLICL